MGDGRLSRGRTGAGAAGFPVPPAGSRLPGWYPALLASVSTRVSTGAQRAVAAANRELLATYWAIGADILARQHEQGWGARIIDRLSADLRERFPGARGYSPRNLKYMRAFAAAWPDPAIVQDRLAQLPWYSQIALLEKLRRPGPALMVRRGRRRERLEPGRPGPPHRHPAPRTGRERRHATSRATLPPGDSDLAQQATRDPYLFDFIGQADVRRERDLEQGLVDHLERFLLELGQGFAFVGRQVHLEIGDHDFYADLLFYHLRLRSFVVIELKATDFDPGYLGQLGMYMAAVDDLLAHPDDKPTIGLLLCRSKNNVVAEYALRSSTMPIGIAEWTTAITTQLPDELTATLPSIEDIEAALEQP